MIFNIIAVGIGGLIGSIIRYLLIIAIKFDSFPLSLVIINATGSFLIGILSILLKENFINSYHLYLFLTVGMLGGFTSFSTFSLETILLFESGKYILATLHIVLSVVVCILMTMFARFITTYIINLIQ